VPYQSLITFITQNYTTTKEFCVHRVSTLGSACFIRVSSPDFTFTNKTSKIIIIYMSLYIIQYLPEMEWVKYKCTRVRLLWTSMCTSTLKTNVLEYEYDYFTMYSSTITLECNHDYFNECPVSNIKATFMESLGVILVLLLCH
jgi:hypothetical protein